MGKRSDFQRITHPQLLELLHYDKETGIFTCLTQRGKAMPGDTTGSWGDGCLLIGIDYHRYKAHHLAWFYVNGEWPTAIVDHKDRNPRNNAITNLRLATKQQNIANCGVRKHNRSGFKGVEVYPSGRYAAHISVKGKKRHLGVFNTPEEANKAYMEAATINFGEFASSG